jgi:hypothetical protein
VSNDPHNKATLREHGVSEDDIDLIDLYYDGEGGHTHAYHVTAAFVLAGQAPPYNAAYTSAESRIIQAHYTKFDPHGSRAADAKLKIELGDD